MAVDFNKAERLILLNQYRILALLESLAQKSGLEVDDEGGAFRKSIAIIAGGYQRDYESLVDNLDETFPEEECHFVLRTLNMFESLSRTIEEKRMSFGEDEEWRSMFSGFDENEESAYLGYARFVIHGEKKFQRFKDLDLKSYSPSVPRYKRMLEAWEKLPTGEQCKPPEAAVRAIVAISA